MSRTELQTHTTIDSLRHKNLSTGSIAVHATASQSPERDVTTLRKPHVGKDDIELAELPKAQDASHQTGIMASETVDEEQAKPPSVRLTAFIQFATLCWTLFLAGWNDGTTGPLLTRMQENYNVRTA